MAGLPAKEKGDRRGSRKKEVGNYFEKVILSFYYYIQYNEFIFKRIPVFNISMNNNLYL